MAQINKPTDYFNTKLYTGNGSTQSITGVGFQPDWVWIKNRDEITDHVAYDVIRGATKRIKPNTTDAESTKTNGITSFDSDGFSLGSATENNGSADNLVSWNWLAGGTASSNTDGSITSTVSANTTAGFSIVSYTGTGASATVGHGLGAVPQVMIFKDRDNATDWQVYHVKVGVNDKLELNNTDASADTNSFGDTLPTSSVFTPNPGGGETNFNGRKIIAYCFAEKKGFSKFGSYTGNGNADGNFVYLGFKPAFVISKNTTTAGYSWELFDNKRNTTDGVDNVIQKRLFPDSSAAEGGSSSTNYVDFLSNGFKIRRAGDSNENNSNYIYMAFAEQPLVGTNNIPAVAR